MDIAKTERIKEMQKKRMMYAHERLTTLTDVDILKITEKKIIFMFKGKVNAIYPFSGFFNGKSVKDGRGIDSLVQQLQK